MSGLTYTMSYEIMEEILMHIICMWRLVELNAIEFAYWVLIYSDSMPPSSLLRDVHS